MPSAGPSMHINKLIQDAVLKLCAHNVTFVDELEVDGVICISSKHQSDIVVKLHQTVTRKSSKKRLIARYSEVEKDISPKRKKKKKRGRKTVEGGANAAASDVNTGMPGVGDTLTSPARDDPNTRPANTSTPKKEQVDLSKDEQGFDTAFGDSGDDDDNDDDDGDINPEDLDIIEDITDEMQAQKHRENRGDLSERLDTSEMDDSAVQKFEDSHGDVPEPEYTTIKTTVKVYKCRWCGKGLVGISNLSRHERMHTGEKPFQCQTCNKKFTSKSHLKRHQVMHTGAKPYACPCCDKRFNRKEHLKKHVKLHYKTVSRNMDTE